jgi:PQQ-like domain
VIRARGSAAWARRCLLAAVLIGAAVIPARASVSATPQCSGRQCAAAAGAVRWSRRLPGTWIAESGIGGTVPAHGEAYAAVGSRVAALGLHMTVTGYNVRNGRLLWTTALTGLPPGSSIVSVRVWPGVVTAGISLADAAGGGSSRQEVVLQAGTGALLGSYPAAAYGGAVAADSARTVIVGNTSVTSYSNGSGRVVWSRPTGSVPQAWQVDGGELYIGVAADGYLGTAPVTALRRISLATGAERVIRPRRQRSFAGTLVGAFDGVVLFSGSAGLSGYNGSTGRLLWQLPGAEPEGEDAVLGTLYLTKGGRLIGVNPATGDPVRHSSVPGSPGLYAVRDGVAVGLDSGALGDAWGYDIAKQRVIWTTSALPWPHYFVDLSGIGGSTDPATGTVLLAYCAALGPATARGSAQAAQPCLRPELVAINS